MPASAVIFEFLSVIGREDDDRVLVEPQLLERVEQRAQVRVGEGDLAVVAVGGSCAKALRVSIVGEIGYVGIEVVDEQIPGLFAASRGALAQPRLCFARDLG